LPRGPIAEVPAPVAVADPALCRIDDPDCESCQ
jgi:hypothetical protein